MAKTLTFKELLIEEISRIPVEKFKDPETFFGEGRRGIAYFTAMNSAFTQQTDIFTREKLSKIIFEFLGKWPYNGRSQLAHAASSIVYYEHYEKAHKIKPPASVVERSERYIRDLDLRDEEPQFEQPSKKRSKNKPVDELTEKLRDLSIDKILAWEKELGVPKEVIKKHQKLYKKSPGLASMNIKNWIKKMIKKSHPHQSDQQSA